MTQESHLWKAVISAVKRCEIQKFARGFTLTGKAGRQNAAGRLNINKNAIQRIECGKRMVKDIELDVFAKIFHVSVDELMYGPKEDR